MSIKTCVQQLQQIDTALCEAVHYTPRECEWSGKTFVHVLPALTDAQVRNILPNLEATLSAIATLSAEETQNLNYQEALTVSKMLDRMSPALVSLRSRVVERTDWSKFHCRLASFFSKLVFWRPQRTYVHVDRTCDLHLLEEKVVSIETRIKNNSVVTVYNPSVLTKLNSQNQIVNREALSNTAPIGFFHSMAKLVSGVGSGLWSGLSAFVNKGGHHTRALHIQEECLRHTMPHQSDANLRVMQRYCNANKQVIWWLEQTEEQVLLYKIDDQGEISSDPIGIYESDTGCLIGIQNEGMPKYNSWKEFSDNMDIGMYAGDIQGLTISDNGKKQEQKLPIKRATTAPVTPVTKSNFSNCHATTPDSFKMNMPGPTPSESQIHDILPVRDGTTPLVQPMTSISGSATDNAHKQADGYVSDRNVDNIPSPLSLSSGSPMVTPVMTRKPLTLGDRARSKNDIEQRTKLWVKNKAKAADNSNPLTIDGDDAVCIIEGLCLWSDPSSGYRNSRCDAAKMTYLDFLKSVVINTPNKHELYQLALTNKAHWLGGAKSVHAALEFLKNVSAAALIEEKQ